MADPVGRGCYTKIMSDGGGRCGNLHALLDYNGAWYGWVGHDEWDGHIFVLLRAVGLVVAAVIAGDHYVAILGKHVHHGTDAAIGMGNDLQASTTHPATGMPGDVCAGYADKGEIEWLIL